MLKPDDKFANDDAAMWRARFEWLVSQHWVEPEAVFRLDLSDTDDSSKYMVEVIEAIDNRLD